MGELLLLVDAEEPGLRFLLPDVYSSIAKGQPPFAIQTSSFRRLTLTICKCFASADMVIELPPVLRFGAMMNAVIIFTKVTSVSTGASNNNKTLAKGVILVFHRLLPAPRIARRPQELSGEQEAYHL